MRSETPYYVTVAGIVCAACLLNPANAQTRRSRNLNINFEGSAEHCSDLKVKSNGAVAQAAETFTLQKSEAPTLEMNAADHGIIKVRGWDHPEYSVEVCRVAAADTASEADQALRSVAVSRVAGRFSASGPGTDGVSWQVYFIVRAPQDANLDIEARNGPVDAGDVSGTLKVRAVNGPVSVQNCSGLVDVHTTNGPISFSGSGGEVHLNAQNGPISLHVAGDMWNGSQLEARTMNGPLNVRLTETFRSGVRVESDGHAPISCAFAACRDAWTDAGSERRVLQMNGSNDTIRITTHNGPISVSGGSKSPKVI